MSLLNNGFTPVVTTTFIIVFFILIIGFIDRVLRHEAIETYKQSLKSFRVIRVFKMNFLNTSLFSLALSLIRFNILFFIAVKTIGNMIFGSDISLFSFSHLVSFIIVSEFLFFLKTRKRNEITELSSLSLVIVLTLAFLGLYRFSFNLVIEKKVIWLSEYSMFSNWNILDIPVIIVPVLYILISLYTRVIKSSVALRYNTVDRLFDFISNNLLFLYVSCFLLRSIFGGLSDLNIFNTTEASSINSIIVLIIKFLLLTLLTRVLIRFLPSVVELRKRNLTILVLLLILNISIVHLFGGLV